MEQMECVYRFMSDQDMGLVEKVTLLKGIIKLQCRLKGPPPSICCLLMYPQDIKIEVLPTIGLGLQFEMF